MIIVTGATGRLGGQVVEQLLTRVPAEGLAVSVRDPAKAAGLARRGVEVRRGDFADPASLAETFAGASRVLVVSVDVLGPEGVRQSCAALDAARAAGAERVFYTSHQAAAEDSLFAAGVDHAHVERHLQETGAPFTSLRNGFYAGTVPGLLLGDAVRTGRLVAPADGPVSWTTVDDLGAGAAALLADPTPPEGLAPPLTAAEAVDLTEVAAVLAEVVGRPVERVVVSDEEWASGLVAQGVPAERAELLLGLFRAGRRGEFAVTDPLLTELLGRTPTTIRTVLTEAVGA